MIATIAELFTRDPSDLKRSPTIIWKPGLSEIRMHWSLYSSYQNLSDMKYTKYFDKKIRNLVLQFHEDVGKIKDEVGGRIFSVLLIFLICSLLYKKLSILFSFLHTQFSEIWNF